MANRIEQARAAVDACIREAYLRAVAAGELPEGAEIRGGVEQPKDTANGDFAANHAMASAKTMHMAPRKIAEALIAHMELGGSWFSGVEAAGPGFLNFRLSDKWYQDVLSAVESSGADYGRVDDGHGEKVMVEFVSANPTGPMTIGNARGGVLGDALASVLEHAGYNVWREFYVNDAGNQVDLFGKSIEARYLQLIEGEDAVEFPDNGYHGDDIKALAKLIYERDGDKYLTVPSAERCAAFVAFGLPYNIARMQRDLERYRIHFDQWFLESSLHSSGYVAETVQLLTDAGLTYEKDGALWLRNTELGADKDEVLRRSNGFYTYYAVDIAYHRNKFIERGFDPERIVKIYNGMDFDRPEGEFDRVAYLRDTYGAEIEDGDVLCGIAARLTAVKDIATTIRGFAAALKSAPQLRLFIAGDGEDEDMLKKLCDQLGVRERVTFCGWVSPVMPFFRAMDINLLSSVSETFPYSILEGVCAGCATICSDVGGMPELIDTGENGYIFPVGDDKRLAEYLIRLGNDAALRQKFADALYEKASRDFSRDKMCERQMENYRHLLARFHRPKNERESIVICGAYGRGNAGDDAILEAIVQEMRQLDPERTICVMSRRPKETRLIYRTNAIYTFNVFSVLRKFRHAALYINGGGSLMQDVTSTRSIWYYCYTLYAAKKRGCKVMMYGCGIGPINRPGNRRMAARTIDASVDRITLRDDNSRALLAEMGVTRPDIRVSADPTIILTPAPREIVNIALEQSGIDPNGKYIGFGLRNWKGLDTALPEIAAAANYAYEKHGLTPVFVPIEFPSDLMPAERVGALLHCPWHAVRTRQPIEVTIGILSRMKTVVGIRLHSLMFSAGQGVPVVGMSYDIKVDGFLKYIGSRTCLQLSSVKAEPLCRLIDECVSGALDNEVHRTAEMMRERESENVKGAAKLLNISEN